MKVGGIFPDDLTVVKRAMPVPYDATIELSIYASNTQQMHQMLEQILAAVLAEKFTLVAPDPRTFNEMYTGDYYVGDRTGKNHYFIPERPGVAQFDLKLKFIEY